MRPVIKFLIGVLLLTLILQHYYIYYKYYYHVEKESKSLQERSVKLIEINKNLNIYVEQVNKEIFFERSLRSFHENGDSPSIVKTERS